VKQNTEEKEEIASLTVRVVTMVITRIMITKENGETTLFSVSTTILTITASKIQS